MCTSFEKTKSKKSLQKIPAFRSSKAATNQGWAPRPAGNPPRGEGGVPRPAPRCGEGGVPRPAPPRKNDQNRGEVAGQNKYPNLNFLQKRKEVMEQYYNTEQCPIQPVNRIGKRHHPVHPLQSNTECYSCGLSLREIKK